MVGREIMSSQIKAGGAPNKSSLARNLTVEAGDGGGLDGQNNQSLSAL